MNKFLLIQQLLWKVVYFTLLQFNLDNMYLLHLILCESSIIFCLLTHYIILCLCYRWMFKTNTVRVTVREGNTELPDDSLIIFGYDVSGRVTSEEEAVSGVTFVLFGVSFLFFFSSLPF